MRVLIKGGVWKNTEDEILKAAVMKYGKNQWARISSLLTRKTPKQCKARWYEWLDPSIRKTEWSKEEDEKLLHLAKIMPTQWRTIAPIVGRTPAQCLERYQRLLDEAEIGDDEGPTADDVRRLRPGEIDPDPESKPARPDPVDMDEDEKEMLSEARARLANTQGKKAKRRAREKLLEEARRLSSLQKKRELKVAGIEYKERKSRRRPGMNYNTDIPFYHPQPAGFWDTNDERIRETAEKKDMTNAMRSDLEGKRRIEIEEEERKKDYKKQKQKKESGDFVPPQALLESQKLVTTERKKLVLPAPQVSEADLEGLVKIGVSGEATRAMVGAGDETPSNSLLGDYQSIEAPTPMRTPRVQAEGGGDIRKQMARNLKALSTSQTPLLGGEINLEGELDFSGTTPKLTVASTPNPLAQNLTPRAGTGPVAGKPFGKTPLRDQMGINTPHGNSFDFTPREQEPVVRQQLSSLFAALPKPKNDFEIVLPESEQDDQQEQDDIEMDQEEYLLLSEAKRKAEEERRLKKRSQVMQKSLPRPVVTLQRLQSIYNGDKDDPIESMINQEKAKLIHRDAAKYPLKEQPELESFYEMEKLDEYIDEATRLIQQEMEKLEIQPPEFQFLYKDYDYDPIQQEFTPSLSKKAVEAQFNQLKDIMKTDAISSQKIEKKLGVTVGGYMQRSKILIKQFNDLNNKIPEAQQDLEMYRNISKLEEEAIQQRLHNENKYLQTLAMIEQDLQDRYRELSYQVEGIQK
ncbi:Cell cycle serine/threonine-protein kinase cdc5/MSD2 [Terramyces sp. JEL0728]|nr:Cell cycle serine/threonine-protein kinase cdc5/MSD2 [Terramyces sp. JEL0728]